MKHNMITSASGWRKVFAVSGDEKDGTNEIGLENQLLSALIAETFADYMLSKKEKPLIVLGMDTRPTGPQIARAMIKAFLAKKINVLYAGVVAAPEIMAYSKTKDAFVYISASHNPIGHNGIKFGLGNGGVLDGKENALLTMDFERRCNDENAQRHAAELLHNYQEETLNWIYAEIADVKKEASSAYRSFIKEVISATNDRDEQNSFFARILASTKENPVGIICDMNGSARTLSVDSTLLSECGISFFSMNNIPGQIAHGIIPEGENLSYCATEGERLRKSGRSKVQLGYMPDCDGDRGNIVYWNEKEGKMKILQAQEVFALSVLAELTFRLYKKQPDLNAGLMSRAENIRAKNLGIKMYLDGETEKHAVVVNCPTSMRINEIAEILGAEVFRAEVGEANVVNLARKKRAEGYIVRILGEGSNGGNITHPSAVRDPLATIFALLKLLILRDEKNGSFTKKGLFHIWCELSGQEEKFSENFTLCDIIETLPVYKTTGVSEGRAILDVKTKDHGVLKANFQEIFEKEWSENRKILFEKYGIFSYEAVRTNGTEEERNLKDFSLSGKGGLKIIFKDKTEKPVAFIWMRGSGTEPVFRVMCDVKGGNISEEHSLLEWERSMIQKADVN